jgi:hypothetical protein
MVAVRLMVPAGLCMEALQEGKVESAGTDMVLPGLLRPGRAAMVPLTVPLMADQVSRGVTEPVFRVATAVRLPMDGGMGMEAAMV